MMKMDSSNQIINEFQMEMEKRCLKLRNINLIMILTSFN